MRKTVVRAGGSIAAAMLVVCMGCSGDATNTSEPLESPSPPASADQHNRPPTRGLLEPVLEWHVFDRSA